MDTAVGDDLLPSLRATTGVVEVTWYTALTPLMSGANLTTVDIRHRGRFRPLPLNATRSRFRLGAHIFPGRRWAR